MRFDSIIAQMNNKAVYRDGDRAVKLFDKDFSKSDILNEALNQSRIEETQLNIPKMLEVTSFDGQWAIVSEYVEGPTLEQLMKEHPEKIDEYLNLFVDLQMSVHKQTSPLLTRLKEKMKRKINMTDLDDSIKYDLHTRLESLPNHYKVCHGDFNPSNIIISKDGTPFIIDWSHVTQGNASADVARSYLYLTLYYEKGIADKYIDLFCEKSGTAKQYVQKWLPIVAASQLVKRKSEERKFLLSWVEVADYQ